MIWKQSKKEEKEKTELDQQIEELIGKLKNCKDEEEKKAVIEQIRDLTSVKVSLEGPKQKLNINTVATCAFTALTVGMIIVFEKTDVLSTKALGFLPKFKF